MIFVPKDNTYNKCYVVQSEGVIRGYDVIPQSNRNYNYRDYYVNSDYIYRDGNGSWSTYSTLPVCLSNDVITNDFYYRVDFPNILLGLFILFFFIVIIPLKAFSKLFKRGSVF